MFRFGLRSVRPVGASSIVAASRFQSTNQQGGNQTFIDPALDIYELKDKAEDGRHIRVAYRPNLRSVAVTNYPQLGPMKKDPNDPVPQFDYEKRTTCRLKPYEVASILCVMESKQTQATLTTPYWDLKFAPHDGGFALTGTINRTGSKTDERDEWNMVFAKTNVTQLYRFLDRSLHESFQFPKKKVFIYQQATSVAPNNNFRSQGTGVNRRRDGNVRRDGGNFRRRDTKDDKE